MFGVVTGQPVVICVRAVRTVRELSGVSGAAVRGSAPLLRELVFLRVVYPRPLAHFLCTGASRGSPGKEPDVRVCARVRYILLCVKELTSEPCLP